jgi:hypothetical protein
VLRRIANQHYKNGAGPRNVGFWPNTNSPRAIGEFVCKGSFRHRIVSACFTDLIKAFQIQSFVHRSPTIVTMPITSSDDILTFLDGMTKRRFFKTHLPKDLMPLQVWDKKPKVSALNVHVSCQI